MARIREMISEGRVRVEGRRVNKGSRLKTGSTVIVEGVAGGEVPVAEAELALAVAHEDPDLVVVEKPAGMATQPLSPEETGTLINGAVGRWPEMRGVGRHLLEPGLLHRLDLKTQGLVMLARNQKAFEFMEHEFRMHRVKKIYRALVQGEVRKKSGEIDAPLAHHPQDSGLMVPAKEGQKFRGEPRTALTVFRTLEAGEGVSLLELELVTGVMHQLRVHLAFFGHPVLGDDRYGPTPDPDSPAYALQAAALTFVHSAAGEKIHVRVREPLQHAEHTKWMKKGMKGEKGKKGEKGGRGVLD